jgi:tRNA (adenine57-N1/adenine58-N1)-methyltransferase
MIEKGDRVVLSGKGREFYTRAGEGTLSTDKGILDLGSLIGKTQGEVITSHLGEEFFIRLPRPTDFFTYAARSGAPMLPKDIGMVIAYTGMNRNDSVLDAGTGSGIAAIYFGGIAARVVTYEQREDFAKKAAKNIVDARLENVEVKCEDVLTDTGTYDIIHFDLHCTPEHVFHAHDHLKYGGYLATYTPFLEQTFMVMDTAASLFGEVHTHEVIGRELTRGSRGTRPSTRVSHSGYITIARNI